MSRTSTTIKRRIFHYSGDVNMEHGGMLYALDTWGQGYVDAIRVTPCSDAGGPDNVFWVERLSIQIYTPHITPFHGIGAAVSERHAHRELHDIEHSGTEEALVSCGWDMRLDDWGKLPLMDRRHAIVQAIEGYGAPLGVNHCDMVRIGPPDPHHKGTDRFDADVVLRASASIRSYAREQCRNL